MTQSTQMPIPVLSSTKPAAVTLNANQFYVFSAMNLAGNYINMTSFIGGNWSRQALTGPMGVLNNVASPINGSRVKSVVVGTVVCVVYQSSDTNLVVITGSGVIWTGQSSPTGMTKINNFELFTDGTHPYILINDNGTLKYAKLDNNTWQYKTLTGNTGSSPSAPPPITNSPLTATFHNGNLHCAYQGTHSINGQCIIDVFGGVQAASWTWSTMMGVNSDSMGVVFFQYNGFLYAVWTGSRGQILVLYYDDGARAISAWDGDPPYDSQSASNPVYAAAAPDVSVVNNGVFICFPDSSGNLQVTYFFFFWSTAQLTGSNAYLPSAPAAAGSPSMTVYLNSALHICYNTSAQKVEDVFYSYPSWYQQGIWP